MKYVKWIFVVLLIGSLTSFVEKDKPTGGLNLGDITPDLKIPSMLSLLPTCRRRRAIQCADSVGAGPLIKKNTATI